MQLQAFCLNKEDEGVVKVRLLEFRIKNIRNVKDDMIRFKGYDAIKLGDFSEQSDILGIEGENGTGKTTFTKAIGLMQSVIKGQELDKRVMNIMRQTASESSIESCFYIHTLTERHIVKYAFGIEIIEEKLVVTKEKLTYSVFSDNRWNKQKTLISYDIRKENFLTPLEKYRAVTRKDRSLKIDLKVAKGLAIERGTSFIFVEAYNLFKEHLEQDNPLIMMIDHLQAYVKNNMLVSSEYANGEIPISTGIGDKFINLYTTNFITEERYQSLCREVEQINVLLAAISPEQQLLMCDQGKQYIVANTLGRKVEIQAIHEEYRVSLSDEASGIKNLISILFYIQRLLEQAYSFVCIDDIDTNLSEKLFRAVMKLIVSRAKGQLLFTARDLFVVETICRDMGARELGKKKL